MDNKEFIAIFKVETEDHIAKLDKGLVDLEKDNNNNELIKEMNREAHTMKGSARVLGYKDIEAIAHKMEDIFEKISQKNVTINPLVFEIMFRSIDVIKSLLKKIIDVESPDVDIKGICKDLDSISGVNVNTPDTAAKSIEKKQLKPQKSITKNKSEDIKQEDIEKEKAPLIEEYIRVPLSRINKFLNLVGELVINKLKYSKKIAQVKEITKLTKDLQKRISDVYEKIKKEPKLRNNEIIRQLNQCNADIQKLKDESNNLFDNISYEALHLDPTIDELQDKIKDIRMLPCSTILDGFYRMVRDIAAQEGKEIDLKISGDETKLDKKVLEGIKASLMHIIRNCIDHGIEKPEKRALLGKPVFGTIRISVKNESGSVILIIEDDGKGISADEIKQIAVKKNLIDKEKLDLMSEQEIINIIFMNGFSSSPIITDVSGRGIGLDIVRRDIENMKGQVSLTSEADKGTKFILELPLSIAIDNVLLLKIEEETFAVPLSSIIETRKVNVKEISTIEGRMAVQIRDKIIPIVGLNDVLGLPVKKVDKTKQNKSRDKKDEYNVVIVSSLGKYVGFIIDEVIGEEEIFIKSLGDHIGKVSNVNGATILGNGEVIIILNVADLITNSSLSHPATISKKLVPKDKRKEIKVLIIEDSLSARELEKSILQLHGYNVDTAVDGLDGLNKTSNSKYDLIISDVEMPRMNGFEFCRSFKKSDKGKDIPVIIVTALEKEKDKKRGIEVGASAYIVKTSFDQSNFIDTIERLIG